MSRVTTRRTRTIEDSSINLCEIIGLPIVARNVYDRTVGCANIEQNGGGGNSTTINIFNNIAHSTWGLSNIVRKQHPQRREESRVIRLEAIELLERLILSQPISSPPSQAPALASAEPALVSPIKERATTKASSSSDIRSKVTERELAAMMNSLTKWRTSHKLLCERDHL